MIYNDREVLLNYRKKSANIIKEYLDEDYPDWYEEYLFEEYDYTTLKREDYLDYGDWAEHLDKPSHQINSSDPDKILELLENLHPISIQNYNFPSILVGRFVLEINPHGCAEKYKYISIVEYEQLDVFIRNLDEDDEDLLKNFTFIQKFDGPAGSKLTVQETIDVIKTCYKISKSTYLK